MSLQDKDILITTNRGQTSDPKIEFKGASASTSTQTVTLVVYPENNGTLSFEGSAGQLFSITNDLTGTIFSVNDVSGIPSIEVDADGTISLAEFSGHVIIGGVASIAAKTFTTSSTSQVAIDTFATGTYRTVKYLVQMTSGSAYHSIELLAVHNGTTVYLSQYGVVKTNSSLGTFDATISSGTFSLLFTPVNSSTTVKFSRSLLVT